MGIEGTAGVKETTGWAGGAALNGTTPRFKARQLQPGSPPRAKTPEEARAHIDMLYKSGRMSDLAGLLRGSEVFREAWLTLQRSTPAEPEPANKGSGAAANGQTESSANLPVAWDPAPGQQVSVNPGRPGVAGAETAASNLATGPGDQVGARPAGTPAHLWKAALRAYRRQDPGYTPDNNQGSQLSLRA